MVKIYKYYDKHGKCIKFEASIRLGNLGYLAGIDKTAQGALNQLQIHIDNFIKPLINIDYSNVEYIVI